MRNSGRKLPTRNGLQLVYLSPNCGYLLIGKVSPKKNQRYYFSFKLLQTPRNKFYIGISFNTNNTEYDINNKNIMLADSEMLIRPNTGALISGERIGILLDYSPSGGITIFRNKLPLDFTCNTHKICCNCSHNGLLKSKNAQMVFVGLHAEIPVACKTDRFPVPPSTCIDLFPIFHGEKMKIKQLIVMINSKKQTIPYKYVNVYLHRTFNILENIDEKRLWFIYVNSVSTFDDALILESETNTISVYKNVSIHYREYKIKHDHWEWEQLSQMCSIKTIFENLLMAIIITNENNESIQILFYIIGIFVTENRKTAGYFWGRLFLHCYRNNEYQIALRIMKKKRKKICYWLGVISQMTENLPHKLLEECQNVVCNRCKQCKLVRSCKGCMKVWYCSRKCQKYDWKNGHRITCSNAWNHPQFYKLLL
eukprot:116747_1